MKTYSFRSVEYNFPYVLDVILPSLGFLNEKAFSDTEQFDPPSLKLEKEYKIWMNRFNSYFDKLL